VLTLQFGDERDVFTVAVFALSSVSIVRSKIFSISTPSFVFFCFHFSTTHFLCAMALKHRVKNPHAPVGAVLSTCDTYTLLIWICRIFIHFISIIIIIIKRQVIRRSNMARVTTKPYNVCCSYSGNG